MRNTTTRFATGIVAMIVVALSLTGCAGSNSGGSTTCGQYRAMSNSQQTAVVKQMLQDDGKSTANGLITLKMLTISAYCATLGSDDSPISDVDG